MSSTTSKWTKLITGAIKFLPEAQWVGIVVELLSQLASSMGATSGDSKEALKHIESVRGDLSQIAAAHTGISQQLSTHSDTLALHSEKLDALSAELHATKLATEFLEASMALNSARLRTLLWVLISMMVVALVLLVDLLLHRN